MERHLGWIVGGVGALLFGSMVPVMAMTVQVPEGNLATQPSIEASANESNSTVHGFARDYVATVIPQRVRAINRLATSAVGGGKVVEVTTPGVNQNVWNVRVHQPASDWQVQVSLPTYSVVQVQKLN